MAKMSNRGMTKKFLISEMDRSVKRMLKLIEEEGDSFAKKAEIYYQKRPILVAQVEDFYRMFRLLAERIENTAPADAKRPPPPELRSQKSGGISDVRSEPASRMHSPPDNRFPRRLSVTRSGGFDFIGNRDGDENWMMESESDSDDSSVFNYSSASTYSNYRRLRKRINELEAELRRVQIQQEVNGVASLQEELRLVKEKLRISEEQVGKLKLKLVEKYQSQRLSDRDSKASLGNDGPDSNENGEVSRLEAQVSRYKSSLAECDHEILKLRNQVTNLLKERAYRIKEWGLQHEMGMKRTEIEEEMGMKRTEIEEEMGIKKTEMEEEIEELRIERDGLVAKVSDLEEEMSLKDDQIEHLNQRLQGLQSECEKSSRSIEELGCRSRELEEVIEKQQEMIEEGAEEKRQAVRQLCITLEHYRNAYQMLRQDLKEQKKPVRFRSSGAL